MWPPESYGQSLLQFTLSDSVCSQSRPQGKFRITAYYLHALSEALDDYIIITFIFHIKNQQKCIYFNTTYGQFFAVGLEN